MNCQEVMEYMQRELDGDLGGNEAEQMLKHIRQCADCAAMYERLRQLSAELENLPKVTPPFSLVDAILPKLDEIDRERAAASAAAGAAEPADSAPPAARRRRNNRFNLRVLGGVVAAGIVAGVFLATYDRDRPGDGLSLSGVVSESSSSSSASSVSSDSAVFMLNAAGDSLGMTDQSGQATEQSGGADAAGDLAASFTAKEFAAESTPGPSSPETVAGGANPEEGSAAGPGAASGSGSAPGSSAGSGSDAGDHRISPPDLLQGESAGSGISEAPAALTEDGPLMGIAGFPEPSTADPIESVSPDGFWIAAFADSRVVIRDRDGNIWFEGEARQGSIAAFGWSDDGAFFRYEVRLEDGATGMYRVDPVTGTETKE